MRADPWATAEVGHARQVPTLFQGSHGTHRLCSMMNVCRFKLQKSCRGLHPWVAEDGCVSKKENRRGELVCTTSPATSWPWAKCWRHRRLWPSSLSVLSAGSESNDNTLLLKDLEQIQPLPELQGLVQGLSETRHFLAALTALGLYSVYPVHFCRSTPFSLALPCFPAVVFVMLYSTPKSNPVLLCFISYAEYCSGLSLSSEGEQHYNNRED